MASSEPRGWKPSPCRAAALAALVLLGPIPASVHSDSTGRQDTRSADSAAVELLGNEPTKWRVYLSRDGTAPARDAESFSSWKDPSYPDGSWREMPLDSLAAARARRFYLRRKFSLSSTVAIRSASIEVRSRKAPELYLNGRKLALRVRRQGLYGASLPVGWLREGRNVLALATDPPGPSAVRLRAARSEARLARIEAKVVDDDSGGEIPARVRIRYWEDRYVDGSGKGQLYRNGFYVHGRFSVEVPPGRIFVSISHGPEYRPIVDRPIELHPGENRKTEFRLSRWINMRERGWIGGEETTVQHDAVPKIPTSFELAQLAARAEGLHFLLEQGSHGYSYERSVELCRSLSTPDIILGEFPELRFLFTGHANQIGTSPALSESALEKTILPLLHAQEEAVRRGGLISYTHPACYPLLHWMSAAEVFSDVALGRPCSALEIYDDTVALMWFAFLNSGVRVAAISTTDGCLERGDIPGKRRFYVQTGGRLSWPAVVEAVRAAKAIVTQGPVFAFLTIDGRGVGETVPLRRGDAHLIRAEIHSPEKGEAVLLRNGIAVERRSFGPGGATWEIRRKETAPCWYVLKCTSSAGWSLTNPIFIGRRSERPFCYAIYGGLGNYGADHSARRRDFFLHIFVTISGGGLREVVLLRDGKAVRRFDPKDGSRKASGRVPCTGRNPQGAFAEGWAWYPDTAPPRHFQADIAVRETGWYEVAAETSDGRHLRSHRVLFERDDRKNRQMSFLWFQGGDTIYAFRGQSEEGDLQRSKTAWWFPRNRFWRVDVRLEGKWFRRERGKESPRRILPPRGGAD